MSEQVTSEVPTYEVTVNNINVAPVRKQKSLGWAYLWLLLLGVLGIHQFYLGKTGRGLLYLLTFGFLTLACWVDLFTLPSQTRTINTQRLVGTR